jgi:hypothetical protein
MGRKEGKAVKIDSELAKKIGEFISRKENNIRYASVKQFIDISVIEKLEKENNIKTEINSSVLSNKEFSIPIIKKRVPTGII